MPPWPAAIAAVSNTLSILVQRTDHNAGLCRSPDAVHQPASPSARRNRCIVTVVERSRTSDRFPGSNKVRVSVRPPASFTVKQTVPTGFFPVFPRRGRRCRWSRRRCRRRRGAAPSAIASATGSDTAPFVRMSAGSTPSSSIFASLEYATRRRRHTRRTGPVGQPGRHQAGGAGFGGGDPPAGQQCAT